MVCISTSQQTDQLLPVIGKLPHPLILNEIMTGGLFSRICSNKHAEPLQGNPLSLSMYCIQLIGNLDITLSMKLQFIVKSTHFSCARKLIFNLICE